MTEVVQRSMMRATMSDDSNSLADFKEAAALLAAVEPRLCKIEEEQEARGAQEAPWFCSLELGRTSETDLSAIFRDLLDPRGTHGQRASFLRLFLEHLKFSAMLPGSVELENATVRCEVATLKIERLRRMDLLIEFRNEGVAILIENKPWARDQDRQLNDYMEHLEREYGDRFFVVCLGASVARPTACTLWKMR